MCKQDKEIRGAINSCFEWYTMMPQERMGEESESLWPMIIF